MLTKSEKTKSIITTLLIILLLIFIAINVDYSYNHRNYTISPFKNQPKVELLKKENNFVYYKIDNTCPNRKDYDYAKSNFSNYSYYTKFARESIIVDDSYIETNKNSITIAIEKNSNIKLYFSCNRFDFPINTYNLIVD